MKLSALAKKAAKGPVAAAYGGAMNVEDMIRFVLFHGTKGADEIERLLKQHQWVMDGQLPDGSLVVPFGRWAVACIAYGREGVAGLALMLREQAMAHFAVGILREVRTPAAVDALLDYCAAARFMANDREHPAWGEWQALAALNQLLALDDFVPVSERTLDRLRETAIRAYECGVTAHLKRTALFALRGAPNAAALDWAERLTVLDSEVESARSVCVRALRKRLAPDLKPLNAEQKRQVRRARAANV
ncbi:hypothetical protein [Pseudacidovorax intermedius]|uniref:hypothetical protein n=1 Tax=Pseudacidovorax intermedius TaxID=433924 RepID=UPI0012DBE4E0|nr:hypothetical protein [Pseudacidovorax intermedius]